jgi:hypothetical protein
MKLRVQLVKVQSEWWVVPRIPTGIPSNYSCFNVCSWDNNQMAQNFLLWFMNVTIVINFRVFRGSLVTSFLSLTFTTSYREPWTTITSHTSTLHSTGGTYFDAQTFGHWQPEGVGRFSSESFNSTNETLRDVLTVNFECRRRHLWPQIPFVSAENGRFMLSARGRSYASSLQQRKEPMDRISYIKQNGCLKVKVK